MTEEIIHVDVVEVHEEPKPRGVLWRLFWTVLFLAAIFLFVSWWPALTLILIASVLLAAVSTTKLARHRALWAAQFGKPAKSVGVATFVRFLAAWFFGMILAVPFVFLVLIVAVVGIAFVVVLALLAIIASLFAAE